MEKIQLEVTIEEFKEIKQALGTKRAESFIKPKRKRKPTSGGYKATKSKMEANKAKIREFLLHNEKPTVRQIAKHVNLSRTTLYSENYKSFINELYQQKYQMKLL